MKYTKTDLLEKLSTGQLKESEAVEFKEQWGQNSGREISAIGNRNQGGWLIIGVNDNCCVLNIDIGRIKKQKEHIENHIRQYLDPRLCLPNLLEKTFNNFLGTVKSSPV